MSKQIGCSYHQINFLLQNINNGDKMKAWKPLTSHDMKRLCPSKVHFCCLGTLKKPNFEGIGSERPIKTLFHSTYCANFKGEGESVLCEGIWNGNLQFCPKWLSEGLYRSKISCQIQWDAQNDSQATVNRLFLRNRFFWLLFYEILDKYSHFYECFLSKKHIFGPLCINLSTPLDPTWNFL